MRKYVEDANLLMSKALGTFTDAESLVSDQVLSWIKKEKSVDNLNLVSRGLRYSPCAIRSLIQFLSIGYFNFEEKKEYHIPNRRMFVINTTLYGFINGFIDFEELKILAKGYTIEGNMPNNEEDLVSVDHPLFNNFISPTIDEVAIAVERERERKPQKKFIFFHGKWNGIPHIAHTNFINDTGLRINEEYGIDLGDLINIVACEPNSYIESVGDFPFLNSDWRISLMSYIPLVNCVCGTGLKPEDDIESFWDNYYRLLNPDFIPVEIGDEMSEKKAARAKRLGIKTVEIPSSVTQPIVVRGKEKRISSGVIKGKSKEDRLKESSDSFQQIYFNLINSRDNVEKWRRNWFKSHPVS